MSHYSPSVMTSTIGCDDTDLEFELTLEEGQCYACGLQDTLPNLPDSHDGHAFHHGCFVGVRADNRSLANYLAARAAHSHNYKFKPNVWRQAVAPFLPAAEPEAMSTANPAAKRKHAKFERHMTRDTDEVLEDDMLLTLDQYVGWKRTNEASRLSHSQLYKEFEN